MYVHPLVHGIRIYSKGTTSCPADVYLLANELRASMHVRECEAPLAFFFLFFILWALPFYLQPTNSSPSILLLTLFSSERQRERIALLTHSHNNWLLLLQNYCCCCCPFGRNVNWARRSNHTTPLYIYCLLCSIYLLLFSSRREFTWVKLTHWHWIICFFFLIKKNSLTIYKCVHVELYGVCGKRMLYRNLCELQK